jgi:hypothetical protein
MYFIEFIFSSNNKKFKGSLHTVDLHGLYVKEALRKAEDHLVAAKAAKLKQTHIITGTFFSLPHTHFFFFSPVFLLMF